jgi:hypothetical protein
MLAFCLIENIGGLMICINCGGKVDTSERVKDVAVMRTACFRG